MPHRFVSALLFILISAPSAVFADSLECQHLPLLFQGYLRSHYSVKAMSDELKSHTIDQFIKGMDPSKTLLLESDAKKLKADLLAVFGTMQSGDCSALDAVSKLMIARAEEDHAIVAKILANKDYKLDESVEIVSDPEKRGFPKTAEERHALLNKMIHFQISNYLISEMKLPEAKKQLVHRYELITKRLKERQEKGGMITMFAEAFATALDPHSSYMSQETLEDFQISMRLSLEGIGASLTSQDGFTVIEDLIPGGGAEKIKSLRPKDKIIAVAQDGAKPVPVIDMNLTDVVKMIRGKKGTKVTLTILRQSDKAETFDVTITRDKIDIKEQAAKITYSTRKVGDKTYKIGVLDLPSFYGSNEKGGRSSYGDVKRLLEEATREKADAIVLNLSRNGGGLLEDAVRISGLFIKKGGVVATKDSDKHVEVLADEDDAVVWPGPVVVLTSRLSASASEILAGALKDYHRAMIVGSDHTFGKGTVQVLSGLPSGLGAMKVTTGMFFLPGGVSTQHLGVASDIRIPTVFSSDDIGEKTMDYSLPPQKVDGFLSKEANSSEPGKHWKPVDESLVKKLAEKSKERVAKDARFAEIQKEIDEAAKNQGMIRLADIRKKEKKAESKADSKKKERDQKMKDLELPFVDEGVNIAVDWAQQS